MEAGISGLQGLTDFEEVIDKFLHSLSLLHLI